MITRYLSARVKETLVSATIAFYGVVEHEIFISNHHVKRHLPDIIGSWGRLCYYYAHDCASYGPNFSENTADRLNMPHHHNRYLVYMSFRLFFVYVQDTLGIDLCRIRKEYNLFLEHLKEITRTIGKPYIVEVNELVSLYKVIRTCIPYVGATPHHRPLNYKILRSGNNMYKILYQLKLALAQRILCKKITPGGQQIHNDVIFNTLIAFKDEATNAEAIEKLIRQVEIYTGDTLSRYSVNIKFTSFFRSHNFGGLPHTPGLDKKVCAEYYNYYGHIFDHSIYNYYPIFVKVTRKVHPPKEKVIWGLTGGLTNYLKTYRTSPLTGHVFPIEIDIDDWCHNIKVLENHNADALVHHTAPINLAPEKVIKYPIDKPYDKRYEPVLKCAYLYSEMMAHLKVEEYISHRSIELEKILCVTSYEQESLGVLQAKRAALVVMFLSYQRILGNILDFYVNGECKYPVEDYLYFLIQSLKDQLGKSTTEKFKKELEIRLKIHEMVEEDYNHVSIIM